MSARHRRIVRLTIVVVWLVVALVLVIPVLAQDGDGTSLPGADPASTAPSDLNEVAARLAPLLVGAALIERALEFLFAWAQRTALDATSSVRGLATRITGLVKVDFRQAYERLDELSDALVRRQHLGRPAEHGDPEADDPAEWPLAQLEEQLSAVETLLASTEAKLKQITDSPLYKERKKMVAGVLSLVLGVLLAFTANLRLFAPLDVSVAGWFEGTFEVLDTVLAGMLMGLGTDWVHQAINILTKGQRALGRAGEGRGLDIEQVRALAAEAIQDEFNRQMEGLREQVQANVAEVARPDSPPV